MELIKAHLVYFSPTSTSKQVAQAIVHGTGAENISVTDITHHSPGEVNIPSDTLTVIAVPVYGGHVAPLAMERLQNIRGDNTPAVLVVVYGNRAYEKALMELDQFAIRHGFSVIAGATFVGEHSFNTQENPISAGRPDEDDLELARQFGYSIFEKTSTATGSENLYPVDVRTIRRPRQPFFPLLGFLRKVIALRKSGIPSPKTPATSEELCIHCGKCVKACPNAAIEKGNELFTDVSKCIRCCACVKVCPENARTFESPMAPLLSQYFRKQKQPQTLV